MTDQPLVSIVTPVYNGEPYISECIESVLSQTYANWEYVIVNNCSTDRTLEICREYAHRDPRVRVHDNTEFLPLVENWNHSLRQISEDSRYCKVVHADDWLAPECVAAMVEAAESDPRVGLVGSMCMRGQTLHPEEPPFDTLVVSGEEALRHYFRIEHNYLGTPTNVLIRSDLLRGVEAFHNVSNHHSSDLESWLTMLEHCSLAFIPELLTFTRHHDAAATTRMSRIRAGNLSRLYLLMKYGERYIDPRAYGRRLLRRVLGYQRFYVSCLLRRDLEAFRYHRQEVERLGLRLGVGATVAALARYLSSITSPGDQYGKAAREALAGR